MRKKAYVNVFLQGLRNSPRGDSLGFGYSFTLVDEEVYQRGQALNGWDYEKKNFMHIIGYYHALFMCLSAPMPLLLYPKRDYNVGGSETHKFARWVLYRYSK